MITLIPKPGRDYKSQAAIEADLVAGRDFYVADMSSPWDGKPCNIDDLVRAGITQARVRYMALRRVHVVPIEITGKFNDWAGESIPYRVVKGDPLTCEIAPHGQWQAMGAGSTPGEARRRAEVAWNEFDRGAP